MRGGITYSELSLEKLVDSNVARIGESICGTCSVDGRQLTYDNQKADGQSKKISFEFDCLRGAGTKIDSLRKSRNAVAIIRLYTSKRGCIALPGFGWVGRVGPSRIS